MKNSILLKEGIISNNKNYTLKSLIEEVSIEWDEPEWGFPKGRRNYQEKDIICALREFEEETGYKGKDVKVIQNIIPFEEIFTGSNYKSYKHKYYLASMETSNKDSLCNFQKSEVSKMGWYTYEDCLKRIRHHNLEKRDILKRVNNLITNYRLYS